MLAFSSREFISRAHSQEVSAGRAFVVTVIIFFESAPRDLNLPSSSPFYLILYTSLYMLDYGTISSLYSEARLG